MLHARSTFAALLLGATLLTPVAQQAAAAPAADVYDGRGTLIGSVLPDAADPSAGFGLSDGSLLWIASPVDGVSVRLLVDESGPWDTRDLEPLRYESADCTGTAVLAAPRDAKDPQPAVVFDTMVFLPAGTVQPHVVRSTGWPLRDGAACSAEQVSPHFCCARLARPETVNASPVVAIDLTSLALSPPLRVVSTRR